MEKWEPTIDPKKEDYEKLADLFFKPIFKTLIYSHAFGAASVVDFTKGFLFSAEDEIDFIDPEAFVSQAVKRAAYSNAAWSEVVDKIGELSCKLSAYTSVQTYESIIQSIGAAISEGATAQEWGKTDAIKKLGILKDDPWYFQNVFRTNSSTYYNAGKWEALNRPVLKKIIQAIEFIAVLDNRTTVICDSMAGVIAPVDDPIWVTNYPPNHYMCRSSVGYISKFENWEKNVPKDVEIPEEPFNKNVGMEFGNLPKNIENKIKDSKIAEWSRKKVKEISNNINEIRKK